MYVPRGYLVKERLALTKEMGYYNVIGHLHFWIGKWIKQRGWQYAHNNVYDDIHPGSILLTSCNNPKQIMQKPLAKKSLNDSCDEKGYHFKKY